MKTVSIKTDYEQAVEAFNNELNDYYEKHIADDRPYFGNEAMCEYLSEFEDALNDGTNLTWELGKKTRNGYVASFSPSEEWEEKHLEIDDGSKIQIQMINSHAAYITMGDKEVYLDNSTGEGIVEITEGED